MALQNLGMYALLFELPLFFSRAHGIDATLTGRSLLSLMIAVSVMSPIGARLSEHIGARASVLIGGLVAGCGALLLRDASTLVVPHDAVPGLVLLGAGLGFSTAPSQAAALNAVDVGRSGMASGLSSTMRYLGAVVGVSVLGLAFDDPNPQRLAAEHRLATEVFVASFVASSLMVLGLPGRGSRRPGSD